MKKQDIHSLIIEKHDNLYTFLNQHPDEKWNTGPTGKWTTGQHIIHLNQSIKPLNKALGLPKFILSYKFGKANRSPRSYDQVVARYNEKLGAINGNIVSPFSKDMPASLPIDKPNHIASLEKQKQILLKRLDKLSDKKLDKYLVPHPLMGRMILREIIMWSAYHVEHHHKILADKY